MKYDGDVFLLLTCLNDTQDYNDIRFDTTASNKHSPPFLFK